MQVHTTNDVAPIERGAFRASAGRAILDRLRDRARLAAPDECCGILLGRITDSGAVVRDSLDAVNAAADVSSRFLIRGEAVLAAQRAAERKGLDVIGFYHSHPRGDAHPSPSDVEAAPAGYLYLIVAAERVSAWRRALPDSPLEEVSL